MDKTSQLTADPDPARPAENSDQPDQIACTTSRPSRAAAFAILFFVWLLVYVGGMFQPGLLDDADSVHAEAAREIVLRHDWVTLHINGMRYLEKAPLMYWGVAASFRAFGVSEWAARLPLVLGVLALMGCMYLFGRRFFGEKAGFYSALIVATGPGIYLYTRFLIPDALVALWLTASLYFFLSGYEDREPSRWSCWGLAVTTALNVLTKGLIGLVFTGGIIFLFLWILGDLGYLKIMRLVSSSLIFLLVASPWHVLAALRNPAVPNTAEKGFLWEYFVNEQFLRYINERVPHDYDKVPLLLFWALTIAWLLPWTAFLIPALKQVPLRLNALRKSLNARGRANLLLLIWALVIVGFFSFSSRQEYYTLPALPALALLVGGWLQRESEAGADAPEKRAGRKISAAIFAVGFACFAIAEALFLATKPAPAGTQISDVITDRPGTYTLSLGHLRDLTLQSMGIFRAPLWEIGVFLLAGTGLAWWLRRRGSPYKANIATVAMMVGVLFCVHQGFVIFSPELSSKALALAIREQYRPGEVIVVNGEYSWGSTLNFYTGAQLHLINTRKTGMWFGSLFPDAPAIFEDQTSLARLWNGQQRVYLFTKEFNAQKALGGIDPSQIFVLAKQGNKLVLTNRQESTKAAAPEAASEILRSHLVLLPRL
ncbi:MAG TPA: glycosyltransferase family 39 protein [Candidatus Limnocylindrales bacterium]|nr:glycosyltransferase family 39 protein [Candidatus Limnocylindrales bacterium]